MHSRFAIAAALSLALISFSAADDLPAQQPVETFPEYLVLAPVFTWPGWYLGISAGYGKGKASLDAAVASSGKFRTSGATFGSTLGYNMQSRAMLIGLETDLGPNWVGGTNSLTSPCKSCEASNPWLGTFRGRVGYVEDTTLYYTTGGLAYGGVRVKDAFGGGEAHDKVGWALGAGIEYAFAYAWSAKFEYLYVDLGKTEFGGGLTTRFNENILRLGLNTHF